METCGDLVRLPQELLGMVIFVTFGAAVGGGIFGVRGPFGPECQGFYPTIR